jgi:hypothetical protein
MLVRRTIAQVFNSRNRCLPGIRFDSAQREGIMLPLKIGTDLIAVCR